MSIIICFDRFQSTFLKRSNITKQIKKSKTLKRIPLIIHDLTSHPVLYDTLASNATRLVTGGIHLNLH